MNLMQTAPSILLTTAHYYQKDQNKYIKLIRFLFILTHYKFYAA